MSKKLCSLLNLLAGDLGWPELPCLDWSSLIGTTLCAAPSKSYYFSTNYHACIAIPTCCRCTPLILFWPSPPFNLFPRLCLSWIFFINLLWLVPLCVQHPAKSMTFQQIVLHVLKFPHDVDVHLIFLCPARYDRWDIMFPGCPSLRLSVRLSVRPCVRPCVRVDWKGRVPVRHPGYHY